MTGPGAPAPARREGDLAGQAAVVLGGFSGIGLETARRARRWATASRWRSTSRATRPAGCGPAARCC
jgi:NAD(P)-dependent dehydrogenase (short-subunit alcohol dehydrogenase family)